MMRFKTVAVMDYIKLKTFAFGLLLNIETIKIVGWQHLLVFSVYNLFPQPLNCVVKLQYSICHQLSFVQVQNFLPLVSATFNPFPQSKRITSFVALGLPNLRSLDLLQLPWRLFKWSRKGRQTQSRLNLQDHTESSNTIQHVVIGSWLNTMMTCFLEKYSL